MTVIGADTTSPTGEPLARMAGSLGEGKPLRLLAVVDGSVRTNRVVDFIASIARGRSIDVVVLNVQEKRDDARLRGYQSFKRADVDAHLLHEVGAPVVRGVCRRLEKLGLATNGNVLIGEKVNIVLEQAAPGQFQAIVIAAPPLSPVQQWLARSLRVYVGRSDAARVAALAPMPVVIV